MASPRNSYESARNDALKVAAVVGTVAAVRWGYREFKEHEDELGHFVASCFALLGSIVMLPLLLPAYIYTKRTISSRGRLRIERWLSERERYYARLKSLQSRVAAVAAKDRPAADEALRPIEREIEVLDSKIHKTAVLWATHVAGKLQSADSERYWLLRRIEQHESDTLALRLSNNDRQAAPLRELLGELKDRYNAKPAASFLDAFRVAFSGRLTACIALGVLIAFVIAAN